MIMALAGNKADLADQRAVTNEEAKVLSPFPSHALRAWSALLAGRLLVACCHWPLCPEPLAIVPRANQLWPNVYWASILAQV